MTANPRAWPDPPYRAPVPRILVTEGACNPVRAPLPSAAWLGGDPELAEAARHVCMGCPVLDPCRAWALLLPTTCDPTILAGMSAVQRARIRKRAAESPAHGTAEPGSGVDAGTA